MGAKRKAETHTTHSKKIKPSEEEQLVCTAAVGFDILSQLYNTTDKKWSKFSYAQLKSILAHYKVDEKLLPNIDNNPQFSISNVIYKNIIRHSLYSFGISVNPTAHAPLFSKQNETLNKIETLLTNFVQNRDITKFMKALEEEGLACNKNYQTTLFSEKEYNLSSQDIKNLVMYNSMMSALIPSYRDSIVQTKMELTRQYFAPLLGFTTLFDGVTGGSNCSIKNFINVASLGENLKSKIPDFRPDDFTLVKYENGSDCIRIIREDSPDSYTNHVAHKDFISLIVQMKLALSYSIRQLLKKDIEEWHEEVTVLGITGSANCSYLYTMHCTPVDSFDGSIVLRDYTLTYVGEYKHSSLKDRISLVSKVITCLIFPKFTNVNNYLKTETHQSTVQSAKKTQPVLFPTTVDCHEEFMSVKYLDTVKHTTRNTIKFCTINGVKCVAKTSSNGMERIQNFLTLYISEAPTFAFSFAGKCMTDVFKDNTSLNITQVFLDLVVQLYLLEENRITHNDIKPENIVLFNEHWFLIDYEIMRPFVFRKSQYFDTYGELLKTKNYSRGYRAPERVKDDLISPKTDVYSCGLVLLELINKKRLQSLSQTDKLAQYIKESKPKDKEETLIFKMVTKHMLAFDPSERLTAKDLIKLLPESFSMKYEKTLQYYSNKDLLIEKYF